MIVIAVIYSQQIKAAESFTFLTWGEYIDPEVVQKFEQTYSAKINFVYFETDDARDRMMVESQGRGFDLILLSGLMLDVYIQRGWLDVIDYKKIPNSKHLHDHWSPEKNTDRQYIFPYFWGTLGIAYRQDLLTAKITSWRQLFKPGESLRGKILMINNAREITGIALIMLGFSMNSNDLSQIKQAGVLLQEQKPYVKKYGYLSILEKSPLITGELLAAMAYSGDALVLKKHHPDIAYVIPEEGGVVWADHLTIGRDSTKKELVMKFINFINQPEIAARNASYVNYASPNQAAEQYLAKEFLNNPIIYPSKTDMNRLNYLDTLQTGSQRVINTIMQDLTRQ